MTEVPVRKRGSLWPIVLLGGGLLLLFLIVLGAVGYALAVAAGGGGSSFAGGRVGVIDISGVILSPSQLVEQLQAFADDTSVRAIVLHIDSPGGGAAASQEVYEEVRAVGKIKPVVASIESVGASGAYYIACGAQKIYANDASVVGSIGVIMEWTNYGDLLRWAKLKPEVLKSGPLKDAGSPVREMTPEEREYFQSLVNNMYEQFVRDVAAGRRLSPDVVKPLATGRVWTGQQALGLHLIDASGTYRDALLATAKQVGIQGEPTVAHPAGRHRGLWALLNGEAENLLPDPAKFLQQQEGFYFLWR